MSDTSVLRRPVDRPGHIEDAHSFDFDMFRDPGLMADPHVRVRELVDEAPEIFWTPRNGGHWMLFGHDAVWEAARDTETFSNEAIPHDQLQAMLSSLPAGAPHVPTPYPIMLDPPLHKTYRQPLQQAFSPRTVKAMEQDIRELAAELIDGIAADGGCDFMAAVAEPLPVRIFLRMFGLPEEKLPEYRAIVRESLMQQADSTPDQGLRRLVRIAASMREELLARRDDPRDDVISLLWQLEIDGKPVSIDDIENYAVLLFIAGLDTVMNAMGYAAQHLAKDQELQANLRANPGLIPEAAEEMLRRYSFVVVPRRVNRDTVFRGVPMQKDERAMLFLPAANLDPKVFPNPDSYDLDRENKVHIAFNAGPHRCLGSHLARLELQVLYEELLGRIGPFRLDESRPTTYLCSHIVGIDKLYLTWDK